MTGAEPRRQPTDAGQTSTRAVVPMGAAPLVRVAVVPCTTHAPTPRAVPGPSCASAPPAAMCCALRSVLAASTASRRSPTREHSARCSCSSTCPPSPWRSQTVCHLAEEHSQAVPRRADHGRRLELAVSRASAVSSNVIRAIARLAGRTKCAARRRARVHTHASCRELAHPSHRCPKNWQPGAPMRETPSSRASRRVERRVSPRGWSEASPSPDPRGPRHRACRPPSLPELRRQ